jgi:thiol-disulfide isomerase/thioredoxin
MKQAPFLRALLVACLTLGATGCGSDSNPSPPRTLDDLEFQAFVDSDGDGLSSNNEPTTLHLSDYFAANRPGTRIIMINAAAGWCAPCMREASALPAFADEFESRGVVILTAVFQDQNARPADEAFARAWAETFMLPMPTLIDTEFQTSQFFDVNTMPANMFVDAETLEILEIATGAETGNDPMREYRELLDFYLQ